MFESVDRDIHRLLRALHKYEKAESALRSAESSRMFAYMELRRAAVPASSDAFGDPRALCAYVRSHISTHLMDAAEAEWDAVA